MIKNIPLQLKFYPFFVLSGPASSDGMLAARGGTVAVKPTSS